MHCSHYKINQTLFYSATTVAHVTHCNSGACDTLQHWRMWHTVIALKCNSLLLSHATQLTLEQWQFVYSHVSEHAYMHVYVFVYLFLRPLVAVSQLLMAVTAHLCLRCHLSEVLNASLSACKNTTLTLILYSIGYYIRGRVRFIFIKVLLYTTFK